MHHPGDEGGRPADEDEADYRLERADQPPRSGNVGLRDAERRIGRGRIIKRVLERGQGGLQCQIEERENHDLDEVQHEQHQPGGRDQCQRAQVHAVLDQPVLVELEHPADAKQAEPVDDHHEQDEAGRHRKLEPQPNRHHFVVHPSSPDPIRRNAVAN
ncbi:MAG: hypothetical protein WKF52_09210 [Sphingomicrobium sp.]